MAAFEVLAGGWNANAAVNSNIIMASGDTLQIRNAPLDQVPTLIQVWGSSNIDLQFRIRSPNMHDNVEGLRLQLESAEIVPQLPWISRQILMPQDTLTIQNATALGASDFADLGLLIYYPELPGIAGRFVSPDEVRERAVDLHPMKVTIAGGPSDDWYGATRITADQDLLRANTDYAILGYDVDRSCASVGIRGVDTGNLRVGGPGDNNARWLTTNWFVDLSFRLGVPAIPVFNSANKNAVFIDLFQGESTRTIIVTLYLARFRAA